MSERREKGLRMARGEVPLLPKAKTILI
jgi:hypothetical protein